MGSYVVNRKQAVFLTVLFFATLSSSEEKIIEPAKENNEEIDPKGYSSHREGKFAAVAVFRIPATSCTTFLPGFDAGYCDGIASCLSFFGAPVGFCPTKLGICCVVKRSCGEQLSTRTGYFVNRKFPQPTNAFGSCQLTINKYQTDVRQIRLDFIQYETDGPNAAGLCETESLTISGNDASFVVPQLCGRLTGQHIYINFGDLSNTITLTQTLNGLTMSTFNIRVTQFRANSPDRAPDGCLQYFTEPAGVVSSLNFDGVTQHLSSQVYDVCVRKPNANCQVTWTAQTYDITGPVGAQPNNCIASNLDYVNFPNSQEVATLQPVSTICDQFPAGGVASTDSFIQVNFNGVEPLQVVQTGFQLNYQVAAEPCA